MRVLTICYEFPPLGGGAGMVVQGLTRALSQHGVDVDLVTMGYRGLPRYEQLDRVNIYRVPCLRLRKSYCTIPEAATYLIPALTLARKLLKKRTYDINHTHFIFPDGFISFLMKKWTGLPYLITTHGSDVPGYNPDRLKRAHTILSPLWKRVTKNAQQIVCPSRSLELLLRKQGLNEEVIRIPNGIHIDQFNPQRAKKDGILVVTRMLERKGVQYFFKALDGMELNHPIHIVGDGPYLEPLRQLAKERGLSVKFWGWLDNSSAQLKRLYETTAIFVFPSESENFPVVLLEAMAAGMAIITTRGTGCAEVVGESALLVEPKNAGDLARALKKLVHDDTLCSQLGQSARKRIEREFGWPAVTEQYLKAYQEAGGCRDGERP